MKATLAVKNGRASGSHGVGRRAADAMNVGGRHVSDGDFVTFTCPQNPRLDAMAKAFMVAALCVAGCRYVTEVGDNPVSPKVYRRWQQENSYYALVEIIDGHLANRPDHNRATKQDVLKQLGEANGGTILQDHEKEWVYVGLDRHVPYGHIVILTFNDREELVDIGWISE